MDAGYERVHDFLQDARNSRDVVTMRAVRQFRREARLYDARYEPPKDALRAKHLALMERRAARTLAGREKGGRFATMTIIVAGTESYTADGRLLDAEPGAAGTFGARVSFLRGRRWSTKNELVDLLCDEGAHVIDFGLTTGKAELAAFLASSERIDELENRNYACLLPNDYPARNFLSQDRRCPITRCVWDNVCYRESVVVGFLASGALSFLEWVGRGDHSAYRKVREEIDCPVAGCTSLRSVVRPRSDGPDGNKYQVGVDPSLVRRSTRQVPETTPAAEPTPLDEDMEEVNSLRGAEPPKWVEGSRSKSALERIFEANPKLISDPPPDSRERRAIATRLCKPNPSTAPDDVDLFDRAFQWGDDQWIAWHDANDVDSEEDEEVEEEEEPADDDPFAEHNVPPATQANRPRLKALYELKFEVPPPPTGNSESRMFPGTFLDWMRHKIVNNG